MGNNNANSDKLVTAMMITSAPISAISTPLNDRKALATDRQRLAPSVGTTNPNSSENSRQSGFPFPGKSSIGSLFSSISSFTSSIATLNNSQGNQSDPLTSNADNGTGNYADNYKNNANPTASSLESRRTSAASATTSPATTSASPFSTLRRNKHSNDSHSLPGLGNNSSSGTGGAGGHICQIIDASKVNPPMATVPIVRSSSNSGSNGSESPEPCLESGEWEGDWNRNSETGEQKREAMSVDSGLDHEDLSSCFETISEIDLSHNRFTELPLRNVHKMMPGIETLNMYRNHISTLPASIGSLKTLTHLNLSRNIIYSLPDELFELCSLEYLNLANNQLSQLPEGIGNLCELKELDIRNNQISKLPTNIDSCTNLKVFYACRNQLTALPQDFLKGGVSYLYLADNEITYLNSEDFIMSFERKRIRDLVLRNNPITHPPLEVCKRGLDAMYMFLKNSLTPAAAEQLKRVDDGSFQPKQENEETKTLESSQCELEPPSKTNDENTPPQKSENSIEKEVIVNKSKGDQTTSSKLGDPHVYDQVLSKNVKDRKENFSSSAGTKSAEVVKKTDELETLRKRRSVINTVQFFNAQLEQPSTS
eukprot:Nk52_evm31s147 gene=Nk52_evmTU31s147